MASLIFSSSQSYCTHVYQFPNLFEFGLSPSDYCKAWMFKGRTHAPDQLNVSYSGWKNGSAIPCAPITHPALSHDFKCAKSRCSLQSFDHMASLAQCLSSTARRNRCLCPTIYTWSAYADAHFEQCDDIEIQIFDPGQLSIPLPLSYIFNLVGITLLSILKPSGASLPPVSKSGIALFHHLPIWYATTESVK